MVSPRDLVPPEYPSKATWASGGECLRMSVGVVVRARATRRTRNNPLAIGSREGRESDRPKRLASGDQENLGIGVPGFSFACPSSGRAMSCRIPLDRLILAVVDQAGESTRGSKQSAPPWHANQRDRQAPSLVRLQECPSAWVLEFEGQLRWSQEFAVAADECRLSGQRDSWVCFAADGRCRSVHGCRHCSASVASDQQCRQG